MTEDNKQAANESRGWQSISKEETTMSNVGSRFQAVIDSIQPLKTTVLYTIMFVSCNIFEALKMDIFHLKWL